MKPQYSSFFNDDKKSSPPLVPLFHPSIPSSPPSPTPWDEKYVSESSFSSPISSYNIISKDDVGGDVWAAQRWNTRATHPADFWVDAHIPMYLYQNKGYGDLSAVLRRSEAVHVMVAAYRHALKDGQYPGENTIFSISDIWRKVIGEFSTGFSNLGSDTEDYNKVGRLTVSKVFGNNNVNYIEIGKDYRVMVTMPGELKEMKSVCIICKKYTSNYCENEVCNLKACALHVEMRHRYHTPLCPLYTSVESASQYVKASSVKKREGTL